MARLRRRDSAGAGQEFILDGIRQVSIGRATDSDIVIASTDVSRKHARILHDDAGFTVIDAGSQNGTFVSGRQVTQQRLRSGDVIRLGTAEFEFLDDLDETVAMSPPPPPPPPPPAPMPPPAAVPVAKPKSGGGLRACLIGCGLFIVVTFGLLFAIYVWWAKPAWVNRLAFWKKPYDVAGELASVGRGDGADAVARDDEEIRRFRNSVAESQALEGLRLGSRVAKTIAAADGGRLETPEHASVDIPPGALAHDAVVEIAPRVSPSSAQRSANWMIVTDVYRIRVDGQDHATFRRPLTVELPAIIGSGHGPVVPLFWDGHAWQPYGGSAEVLQGRIRYRISHATETGGGILSTAAGAAGWVGDKLSGLATLVAGGVGSATGTRSEVEPWVGAMRPWGGKYVTPNFAIYYTPPNDTKYPQDCVMADGEYPLANGRKSSDVPLYVRDVGEALETAHTNTQLLGIPPATSRTHERFTAFVEHLSAFGESPLGGPLYLDNRMSGVNTGVDWGEMLLTTATHEYMHMLQDDYYNLAEAGWNSAWMETSAQTLADLERYRAVPKQHPSPYLSTRNYMVKCPEFPKFSMDSEGRGEKDVAYAWATFFLWLETDGGRPGITVAVLKDKARYTNVSSALNTLQDQLRKSGGGALSDRFVEFCKAYFHDDAQKGTIHSLQWWQYRPNQAMIADSYVKEVGLGEQYYLHKKFDHFTHLTGRYFFGDAQRVKPSVPAKVVVSMHSNGDHGALLYVYRDRYQDDKAAALDNQPQETVLRAGADETVVLDDFLRDANGATTANRIGVLAVNDSITADAADLDLRMWMLLPPSGVTFDPSGSGDERKYVVSWIRSPLAPRGGKQSDTPFLGYNVYRRKLGTTEWTPSPLNQTPLAEERYVDAVGPVDMEYAVTVVDNDGHESAKSIVETNDPFVGEWHGSFRLKDGHLADTSKMTDQQRRDYQPIIEIINKLESIAKLGIPVTFRIERGEGRYYMKPLSVFGATVQESARSDGYFSRLTEHNLEWHPYQDDGKGKPLYFSLEYPDDIHNTYPLAGATIEWHFKRTSGK